VRDGNSSENSIPNVKNLLVDLLTAIEQASSSKEMDELKVHYFGKKGLFTNILKSVGNLDPEKRKELGLEVNDAKKTFEARFSLQLNAIKQNEENEQLAKEWLDVTLPLNIPPQSSGSGSIHPVSIVRKELEDIFLGLGFDVVDGPEVDSEFFNFESLNIPGTHPARDMQDTIWTTKAPYLMRTHTSTNQVRTLLERGAPVRIVAPGRCFRYERLDATHEHTFYQMDGMMVDRKVSVGHLIYFMKTLLRKIYGFEPKIRLRPGYFPFVEPGFELDIWFNNRWLELLPCGLMHPEVLKHGGLDPKEWQGFAFGLGLSRLVMTRFQIDDIRHMQSGDLRFLRQF